MIPHWFTYWLGWNPVFSLSRVTLSGVNKNRLPRIHITARPERPGSVVIPSGSHHLERAPRPFGLRREGSCINLGCRSSWFEFSSARLRRTWSQQGTGSGEVGGVRAPHTCARTLDPLPEFLGISVPPSLPRAHTLVPAPGSLVPGRAYPALPPQDLSPGGEQRESPRHQPQLLCDRRREA